MGEEVTMARDLLKDNYGEVIILVWAQKQNGRDEMAKKNIEIRDKRREDA